MNFVLRLARDTFALPVIPVAVGVVVAAAVRSSTVRRAAATLAMTAGIVIAHLVNVGVPRMPPVDTIGWIPLAVAIASLGLLVDSRLPARLVAVFVITSAAALLIGRPAWGISGGVPWIVLAASVSAAIVGSLEIASRRMPPAAMLLALAMTTASTSIACLLGHSALLAQVLGASAAVVGASGLAAVRIEPAKTGASVAVISAIVVVIYARLYASLSVLVLVLLAMSASAPMIMSWLPLSKRVRSITSVVVAITLGFVAVLAAR